MSWLFILAHKSKTIVFLPDLLKVLPTNSTKQWPQKKKGIFHDQLNTVSIVSEKLTNMKPTFLIAQVDGSDTSVTKQAERLKSTEEVSLSKN